MSLQIVTNSVDKIIGALTNLNFEASQSKTTTSGYNIAETLEIWRTLREQVDDLNEKTEGIYNSAQISTQLQSFSTILCAIHTLIINLRELVISTKMPQPDKLLEVLKFGTSVISALEEYCDSSDDKDAAKILKQFSTRLDALYSMVNDNTKVATYDATLVNLKQFTESIIIALSQRSISISLELWESISFKDRHILPIGGVTQ